MKLTSSVMVVAIIMVGCTIPREPAQKPRNERGNADIAITIVIYTGSLPCVARVKTDVFESKVVAYATNAPPATIPTNAVCYATAYHHGRALSFYELPGSDSYDLVMFEGDKMVAGMEWGICNLSILRMISEDKMLPTRVLENTGTNAPNSQH